MCLYPKLILNRKYKANKKNKGNPPEMKDHRTKYVPVGCGKCMECKRQKAREWTVRLIEEVNNTTNGKFVTMTFSDEAIIKLEKAVIEENPTLKGYDLDNAIATQGVRWFLERWRKEYKTSVRHWLVTELGQKRTERIHIHGILWTDVNKPTVEKIWQYGNVNKRDKNWEKNYVSERTVNYIVKYISKADEKHKYYNPKVLTSKGIGMHYINRPDHKRNKFKGKDTRETYTTRQGIKLALPKYYRNKIYTEEQKEQLWINLLDKNVRYINGIKIDISKNEDDYYRVLNTQRVENKSLGYGDDEKNWEQMKYEQQRRNMKREERIKKEVFRGDHNDEE